MEKLVRIDKNGTKYFENDVCPKCGGSEIQRERYSERSQRV